MDEIKNNNTDFNNFNDIVQNETNEICQWYKNR
jgi:hypothetical protein